MQLALSNGIQESFPDLQEGLREVAGHCRYADRDIRTKNLLVEARRAPAKWKFYGRAWPMRISWNSWGTFRSHENGRILLTIGESVEWFDIIRLFAHELRHIGQFRRGEKKWGYLTADHMGPAEVSEEDAYLFEYRILDKMGVQYP